MVVSNWLRNAAVALAAIATLHRAIVEAKLLRGTLSLKEAQKLSKAEVDVLLQAHTQDAAGDWSSRKLQNIVDPCEAELNACRADTVCPLCTYEYVPKGKLPVNGTCEAVLAYYAKAFPTDCDIYVEGVFRDLIVCTAEHECDADPVTAAPTAAPAAADEATAGPSVAA
jgi:hypothetical protein